MAWAEPVRVLADDVEVPVADDGSFTVPVGSTVMVRSGPAATRAAVPSEPPLPERRV
jgi:hypothetical protein